MAADLLSGFLLHLEGMSGRAPQLHASVDAVVIVIVGKAETLSLGCTMYNTYGNDRPVVGVQLMHFPQLSATEYGLLERSRDKHTMVEEAI
jgi:hypothetical protein